jgi:hypothetical protein
MQIALNGSGSEDPEGFNLATYTWYVGSTEIDDITGVVGVWTAPAPGTYTFKIVVEDQGGLPEEDTCQATV